MTKHDPWEDAVRIQYLEGTVHCDHPGCTATFARRLSLGADIDQRLCGAAEAAGWQMDRAAVSPLAALDYCPAHHVTATPPEHVCDAGCRR